MVINRLAEKLTDRHPQTLVVDTDGGVDDAVACLVAADLLDLPHVTFTSVGGNVSAHQAAQNVAQVTGRQVHIGADPPGLVQHERHGRDGLHGHWDGQDRALAGGAQHVLVRALQDAGAAIACIGPLTNLAQASKAVGSESIRATVFALGGTAGAPAAICDTNVQLDPVSAHEVADTVQWISLREAAERSRTPLSSIVNRSDWKWVRPFAQRTSAAWSWTESFPLYDVAVVCAAVGRGEETAELIKRVLD